MSFYIVEVDNDGFKIYNSSGTLIDPATDAVAQAIRDRIGEVSATPTANTVQDRLKDAQTQLASLVSKDYSTETTLAAILVDTGQLETLLTAIKDTDGVKKIVDALPAGTNNIGDVDVVSSALPTGAATEATLSAILVDTGQVETLLTAIKDTDGIKKITDALPAGTNNIGDVDVVSSALPTGAATEATLATLATETTADAIRDNIGEAVASPASNTLLDRLKSIWTSINEINLVSGIKKIVDALPVGDNLIGRVKLSDGTDVAEISSGGQVRQVLYDDTHNVKMPVAHDTAIPTNTKGLIIAGQDDNTKAQFIKTTSRGEVVTVGTEIQITGFGETRVASPFLIGNLINKYQVDPYWYDTSLSGGGAITHVANQSAVKLEVGAASGDVAKLRTNNYFRYQAGRSMLIRITGYQNSVGNTNQKRYWGFGDDNDGLFFEIRDTTVYVVQKSSVSGASEVAIPQTSWNKDRMDGAGDSGFTLDVTKGNIYEITFQWLGVGPVSFFVNGIECHRIQNPNIYARPYMKTATLPLSWGIENSGASTAGHFHFICASVSVEGGSELPEYTFAAYNSGDVTVTATEIPLLSIRLNSTFNSIENRMVLVPSVALVSNSGGRTSYRFVLNGSLTGASWVSVDSASGAQYDVSATALTGGITLLRGLLPNDIDRELITLDKIFNSLSRALRRKAFTGVSDTLTIMGKNEKTAGGSSTMRSSLTWFEIR